MTPRAPLLRALLLVLPLAPLATVSAADTGEFPASAYAEVGSSLAVSSGITRLGWTEAQFDAFVAGMRAAVHGQPLPLTPQGRSLHEEIGRRLQELSAGPAPASAPPAREFSDASSVEQYMQEMVAGMQMQRLDSGLAYLLISSGVGSRPAPEDTVVISYSATGPDGSTEYAGLSARHRKVRVSELLPGLAEGVQLLVAGGQGMFILPPELSFGSGAWPAGVPQGVPLIFTVTLHEIVPGP